jgi:DNA-binding PadR family transcriptional regulator
MRDERLYRMGKILEPDLPPAPARAIVALLLEGPMTTAAGKKRIGMSTGATCEALLYLQTAGLVDVHAEPHERRPVKKYQLSAAGRERILAAILAKGKDLAAFDYYLTR